MLTHLEYHGITDPAEQLRFAITQLDGNAKVCWRNHAETTTDPVTRLPTAARCPNVNFLMHNLLRPEFLSSNYVESARNELSECRQTGNVTDYIASFCKSESAV